MKRPQRPGFTALPLILLSAPALLACPVEDTIPAEETGTTDTTGDGDGDATGDGDGDATGDGDGDTTGDDECGNGAVEGSELCDDGNLDDTDECTTLCAPPSCSDGLVSGDESDLDCGGSCGATCANGEACVMPEDCLNGACDQGVCTNACGNGMPDPGEACDDGNADEADGCLSDCTVPLTCAEILAVAANAGDGEYTIAPDGATMQAYCDMSTDGGGWTLVAKVNDADMDNVSEPDGWFNMALAPETLTTSDFTLNQGLASHGASRFADALTPGSVARFEVFAADDLDTSAKWFKAVASEASFNEWFAADLEPSQVCRDVDMSLDCADGSIDSVGGLVELDNMMLEQYGYTPAISCNTLAMRLDSNNIAQASGVSSCTDDVNWPVTYFSFWGNALHVWLR